jgi:arylformamidase
LRIIDISVPLSKGMPVWPGDLPPLLDESRCGSVCVTQLSMGLHSGTHVDFPYHIIPGGNKIDTYTLDRFIGRVRVVTIESTVSIQTSELKTRNLAHLDKIIFKTCNSLLWQRDVFEPAFIGLEPDAAQYLVDCGVKLVGIDYLSIQPFSSIDNSVHTILLKNDVLILEGVNMSGIEDDEYQLFCCPLHIQGVEASPVRALLIPLGDSLEVNR